MNAANKSYCCSAWFIVMFVTMAGYSRVYAVPPAIEGEAITGVIERIKQDIGYYDARENQDKKTMPAVSASDRAKCQMGHYDFKIDKVEVELNAIQADTLKGDLGLKIPFGSSSIGPGGSLSRVETASQALTIDLFPVADPNFILPTQLMNTMPDPKKESDKKPRFAASSKPGSPPPRITPISDTLIALRNNLAAAAESKPCLETLPRKGATIADQIKIEFQVDRDTDANVGFDIVVVSIKAEAERKNTASNTLTISFSPVAGAAQPTK